MIEEYLPCLVGELCYQGEGLWKPEDPKNQLEAELCPNSSSPRKSKTQHTVM